MKWIENWRVYASVRVSVSDSHFSGTMKCQFVHKNKRAHIGAEKHSKMISSDMNTRFHIVATFDECEHRNRMFFFLSFYFYFGKRIDRVCFGLVDTAHNSVDCVVTVFVSLISPISFYNFGRVYAFRLCLAMLNFLFHKKPTNDNNE